MRQKRQKQMPLMNPVTDHAQSQELKIISEIIDENPTICDLVLQDLQKGRGTTHKKGANGMSADQVLRFAIVKVLFGYPYQDLAFHTVDSRILSWFCRIGFGDKGFKNRLEQ